MDFEYNIEVFDYDFEDSEENRSDETSTESDSGSESSNIQDISEKERSNVLKVVEDCILEQLEALANPESESEPAFTFPNFETCQNNIRFDPEIGFFAKDPNLEDVYFSQIKLKSRLSVNKYVRMLLVLNKIHELLVKDEKITKRELYYQLVRHESGGNMSQIDNVISTIVVMLQIPRGQLRILATSKGLMAGNLKYF